MPEREPPTGSVLIPNSPATVPRRAAVVGSANLKASYSREFIPRCRKHEVMPMTDALLLVAIVQGLVLLILLIRLPTRLSPAGLVDRLACIDASQERMERGVRDEVSTNREEAANHAMRLRDEVGGAVRSLGDSVL